MDDYLFVTTCPRKAKAFLDTMTAGHPEYGCMISEEKTLTNFDYDTQIMNVIPPGQKRTSFNDLSDGALIGATFRFPLVWVIDRHDRPFDSRRLDTI